MMKRVMDFLKSQWPTIRVVGTFVGLIAAFFSLLTYTPLVERFDLAWTVARGIAWLSGWLLSSIGFIGGFPVVIDGTNLASGTFRVEVSPGCSGVVPTMIYLSAVFAYPSGWRSKLIGTALGIGVIACVNLLRVITLFLIGIFAHQYFHDTHVYVAQALVVAIAAATWLFWAGRFADAPGD